MKTYFLKRVFQLVPIMLVVIVLNFVILHLAPGDVVTVLMGDEPDPAFAEEMRERFMLDQPLHMQFWAYFSNVLTGDLGDSLVERRPVVDILLERMPATLLLVGTALSISATFGTLLGASAAKRAGQALDVALSMVAVALYSVPIFWMGLMLVLLFSLQLGWFPISGMFTPGTSGIERWMDVGWHLVLPVATLVCVQLAQYIRISRASVAESLNEDYITTARAAGYSDRVILVKFALRNALLPVVTIFGLQVGLVLTGAILTETVFAWPGLGRTIYTAILTRDTPLIIGAQIFISFSVLVATLVSDLVYSWLDPRVVIGK